MEREQKKGKISGLVLKVALFAIGFMSGLFSDVIVGHLGFVKKQATLGRYIKSEIEAEIKSTASLNRKMQEIYNSSRIRIVDDTPFRVLHKNYLSEKIGIDIGSFNKEITSELSLYLLELEVCSEYRDNFIKLLKTANLDIDKVKPAFDNYSKAMQRLINRGERLIELIDSNQHSCILNFLH